MTGIACPRLPKCSRALWCRRGAESRGCSMRPLAWHWASPATQSWWAGAQRLFSGLFLRIVSSCSAAEESRQRRPSFLAPCLFSGAEVDSCHTKPPRFCPVLSRALGKRAVELLDHPSYCAAVLPSSCSSAPLLPSSSLESFS